MDVSGLVQLCFDLIVAGIFLTIVWVVLGMIPMLAPFKQILMLVFTLVCVIVLFNILAPALLGGGLHLRHYG